jgi:HD-GYP domain-containing protein (c-di-GMP phosphodiesterase class II)
MHSTFKATLSKEDQDFLSKASTLNEVFSGPGVSLQRGKVAKGKTINISVTRNGKSDDKETDHILFVQSGSLLVTILADQYRIQANEALSLTEPESYSVFAEEDSRFLFFTTSALDNDVNEERLNKLNEMVAEKDSYTEVHSKNVGLYAQYLANLLIPGRDTAKIRFAGLFHDVGKIYIPSEILNKPAKLTPEEFEIVKKHPIFSFELIKPVFDEETAILAKHHHEMIDGSGYPDHLSGEQINLPERILAAADVFDALTSPRPYRPAYTFQEAFGIIDSYFKNKLDANVVQGLKALVSSKVIKPL